MPMLSSLVPSSCGARRRPVRLLGVGLILAAAVPAQEPPAAPAPAPDPLRYQEIDYATLDRRIAREPVYIAEPRYALFVLDLAGRFRCWAVADKSAPDAAHYDVLYFDRDGDGDLTEPGERITGQYDAARAAAGLGLTLGIGDVKVPGTELVHTKFRLSTTPKAGRCGFWFQLRWNGEQEMSGGYGPVGIDTTTWQPSAATAPVFRPCPHGPLSFGAWGSKTLELRAGQPFHLNVIAGNAGSGPDTLAVVDEHFLDLKLDRLLVTVIARDKDGREVRAQSRIQDHC